MSDLAERLRKMYAPQRGLAQDDFNRHLIWPELCAVVEAADRRAADVLEGTL
jgi:hypothetical protein